MRPILFELGPVTIYSYGALIALAFLIGTHCFLKGLKRDPIITPSQAIDLALCILIFGILGARLFHVVLNFDYYVKKPIQILLLNKGGLAFHGGIFTAAAVSLYFVKKWNLSPWKLGDVLMPCVALGHSIGRIGCFLNGCCFGKPTDFLLRIMFPGDTVTRHPVQLYSAVGLFVIFLILKVLYNRRHFDGQILLSYFLLYSVFRFFIDFLRADILPVVFGLTISQLINITMFLVAVVFFLLKKYEYVPIKNK